MMPFSDSDLEIIRKNPLKKFRADYQDFFCSRTGLTLAEVQERPEILDIIGDSDVDARSRELFQVFLCELSFTQASRELMYSGEPYCKNLLLFAGEYPKQLKRSGDALGLCTALLQATLVPDPADADLGIWLAAYNLLTAFLAQDTLEAREGVIRMAATCAMNYAKEHPYLLGVNVALTVVGLAPATVTGPFLGMLGFGAAGVRASSAAAGWQSMLGAVPKGSLFSACQSIAATGSAPVVSGCSWVANAGYTGFHFLRGRR